MLGRYQNRKACLLENDSIYVLPYLCRCFMRYATRHTYDCPGRLSGLESSNWLHRLTQ